jgi:hypothetical protein
MKYLLFQRRKNKEVRPFDRFEIERKLGRLRVFDPIGLVLSKDCFDTSGIRLLDDTFKSIKQPLYGAKVYVFYAEN